MVQGPWELPPRPSVSADGSRARPPNAKDRRNARPSGHQRPSCHPV